MGPSVEEILTICSKILATMPISGKKTINTFLLRNKKSFAAESWMLHHGLKIYQVCSNGDPMMTSDLFIAWLNLCPICCGNTGRLLHGICRHVKAVRIVAHGSHV